MHPGLAQLLLGQTASVRARLGRLALAVTCLVGAGVLSVDEAAGEPRRPPYPVGVKTVEHRDEHQPSRFMVMSVFYPAVDQAPAARPLALPFQVGITVYLDARIAFDGARYPLVMLSHGRGGNRFNLAWLAQYLASHGYIVASVDHHMANTYHASIEYLASKIWQRPVDISANITYLLKDKAWRPYVDAGRIGVAGFSQGGFTALWIGGARVNRDRFLAFQRRWADDPVLPPHVKKRLPILASPALHVHDPRVKAVFAMAPGIITAFGFDEARLGHLRVPTYIIAGAADSVVPVVDNAELAAPHIPGAQLTILPGPVQHYVFMNECDEEGKAEFLEACGDDPSVDRAALHQFIGSEALRFFDSSLGIARSR